MISGSYLPDRHPADGRVQHTGVRVGTHLRHEGEPLPPANTVLLNLLSVGKTQDKSTDGESLAIQPSVQNACISADACLPFAEVEGKITTTHSM